MNDINRKLTVILRIIAVVLIAMTICTAIFIANNNKKPLDTDTSAVGGSTSGRETTTRDPVTVSPVTTTEPDITTVPDDTTEPDDTTKPVETTIPDDTTYTPHTTVPPVRDNLEGCAFIGDSITSGLSLAGIFKGADYFTRVGLNVTTALTLPSVNGSQIGTVPLIDELKEKEYERVIIMLGHNELGWAYPAIFRSEYAKLIDAVRERQPDAIIYIQSILPITAKRSDEKINMATNDRIREFNVLIKELAGEKKVIYLDSASAVANQSGCLPDDASPDGVHLNRSYLVKWADYIKKNL